MMKKIKLEDILEIFFSTHDPTTLNQGNDFGTQYRSGIYYTEIKQKEVANLIINKLQKEKLFQNPIVTEVKKPNPFLLLKNILIITIKTKGNHIVVLQLIQN